MKIKLLILEILLLGLSIKINAQDETPDVLPNSPEVAGLGKFGIQQVSEYSGHPQISIPIYTLKHGDIEVPISLSYDASGIKVDQEATFIGLGWNLIAGGTITYIPVGTDERIRFPGIVPYYPLYSWNEWEDFFLQAVGSGPVCYSTMGCGPREIKCHAHAEVLQSCYGRGEGEQDIYSASFLNYSFKFFFHPSGNMQVVFIGERNKCNITMYNDSEHFFLITGENGLKYYFEEKEISASQGPFNGTINCWYLTKIEDLNRNTVHFKYTNSGFIYTLPIYRDEFVTSECNTAGGNRHIYELPNRIRNVYLTEIYTENEKVEFILSNEENPRLDIRGDAQKLSAIKVTDKLSNEVVIHYSLEHGYFNESSVCEVGGNYLAEDDICCFEYEPSSDQLSKRLKLVKLSKINPLNPSDTEKESYSFTYNETHPLPLKTSFAKDFWGYYNGQENDAVSYNGYGEHTLLPKGKILSFLPEYKDIHSQFTTVNAGGNRGMSSVYATAGMIKSITYPTGGRTEYTFEPHTFSNTFYLSAEDQNLIDQGPRNFTLREWNDNGCSENRLEISTFITETEIQVSGYIDKTLFDPELDLSEAFIQIKGDELSNTDIEYTFYYDENDDVTNPKQLWNPDIPPLPPGRYRFHCNLPDDLGSIYCRENPPAIYSTLNYYSYNPTILDEAESIGVGLRVSNIKHFDENNEITSEFKYIYENENGTSSGKDLTPITFYWEEDCYEVDGAYQTIIQRMRYMLSADNYSPQAMNSIGVNVGYSRVVTQQITGSNFNGSTIHTFKNDMPINILQYYFFFNNTNGNLLEKVIKDAQNRTVRRETYIYGGLAEGENETLNAIVRKVLPGSYNFFIPDIYRIIVYYANSYTNTLGQKVIVENGVETTKTYLYYPENYSVSEMTETTSQGVTKLTQYKYPHNFSSSEYIYESMINDYNRINPEIEVSEYLENNLVQRVKTNYVSSVINPQNVQVKTGTNPTEIRLIYDRYDDYGNILQYHKSDDIDVSYIWGYNNTLPVAKIENATYDEMLPVLSSADRTSLNNATALSISQVNAITNKIRTGLPDALVTTYTYAPLIGVTSITNERNVTTYYEYDDFNRLKYIKDFEGNVLKRYEYNYAK